MLNKSFWFDRYDKDWRKTAEGQFLLENYLHAHERYLKISSKLNLTENQEQKFLHSCYASRYYGGSF